MMELSRGRQMVQLATKPRYHVVKILQLNEIKTVRDELVRASNDINLKIVTYNGRDYHAVLYDSGDFPDMEITRDKLVDYERKLAQYRNFGCNSQAVQTDTVAAITDELQEGTSFLQLQSAFSILREDEDETMESVGYFPRLDEGVSTEYHEDYGASFENQPSTSGSHPVQNSKVECSEGPRGQVGETVSKPKQKKKHCLFCRKDIGNLSRHLIDKHRDEERVQKFMYLPVKHPDRLQLLAQLRAEGYTTSRTAGRPNTPVRQGGKHPYVPCPKCGALYSKRGLYKHHIKCTETSTPKNLVAIVHTAQEIEKCATVNIPERLKNVILPRLKADEQLMKAIITDQRIIDFGNDLCLRFGEEIHKQGNLVRQKLRTLAQIKLLMKEEDQEIKSIEDVFQQSKWSTFISSVMKFSKLDNPDLEKKAPTQVRSAGLIFLGLAKDIFASYSPEDEMGVRKRNRIQGWIDFYNRKYGSTIGWQASKLINKKSWKGRKRVPLASDLVKLNTYVKNQLSSSVSTLQKGFNEMAWENGSKAAMLTLLLFNRKRKGELETCTVEDYNCKSEVEKDSEIYKGMTATEKLMSSRYYHLVIRGKFVRPVPLLIKKDVAKNIEILLKYRNKAEVHQSNPYLFAKPSGGSYSVDLTLREAAYECGADNPSLLNSTGLRKHMATVSQALDLTDTDLQTLCGFLGHTAKTHLEYYRMPSDVTHTARLAKVLETFNKGEIHKYRGKTIDEIDINDDILSDKSDDDPDDPIEIEGQLQRVEIPRTPPKKGQSTPSKTKKSPKIKGTSPSPVKRRIRWSTPEKRVMKRAFSRNIMEGTLPSFQDLHDLRLKETILAGRKPTTMKAWVSNQIRKLKLSTNAFE